MITLIFLPLIYFQNFSCPQVIYTCIFHRYLKHFFKSTNTQLRACKISSPNLLSVLPGTTYSVLYNWEESYEHKIIFHFFLSDLLYFISIYVQALINHIAKMSQRSWLSSLDSLSEHEWRSSSVLYPCYQLLLLLALKNEFNSTTLLLKLHHLSLSQNIFKLQKITHFRLIGLIILTIWGWGWKFSLIPISITVNTAA